MDGPSTPVDVSLCIATCERPDGLARLLASLGAMKVPDGLRVEIVVVDNAPEGSRVAAAERPATAAGVPIRWRVEPERGISHARNRGVATARGRWLGFLDDDEVVEEGWLDAYWAFVHREGFDGAFGPVEARLEAGGPGWFDPTAFFDRRPGRHGERLTDRGLHAGNAFVKRSLLERRSFDPAFGRSGGEDTQLFRSLVNEGAHFAWCAGAIVREFVPGDRQTLRRLLHRAFRGGQQHATIEARLRKPPVPAVALLAAALLAMGLAALCLAVAPQHGVRHLLDAAARFGRLHVSLGGTLWAGYGAP